MRDLDDLGDKVGIWFLYLAMSKCATWSCLEL